MTNIDNQLATPTLWNVLTLFSMFVMGIAMFATNLVEWSFDVTAHLKTNEFAKDVLGLLVLWTAVMLSPFIAALFLAICLFDCVDWYVQEIKQLYHGPTGKAS